MTFYAYKRKSIQPKIYASETIKEQAEAGNEVAFETADFDESSTDYQYRNLYNDGSGACYSEYVESIQFHGQIE